MPLAIGCPEPFASHFPCQAATTSGLSCAGCKSLPVPGGSCPATTTSELPCAGCKSLPVPGASRGRSARIHSPRGAELARRFYLHLAKQTPRLADTTAGGSASGGGNVVADPDGPRLLQAKATTVGTVVLTFQARRGGDSGNNSGIHLHGTAGCISGFCLLHCICITRITHLQYNYNGL